MANRQTVYVVPNDGTWAVKGEGRASSLHATQAEAIEAARHMMLNRESGQYVVLGRSGKIVEHGTHRLPKVKQPPRKGAKRIEEAVGRVALERFGH